ncbi:hypothetical protein L3X38_026052 [Prunus dulcis]|uniref:RNase H type-1 domain-containing protein n=1 Tax=Prunus dulcis TaxID=3755 RepID=A0AAD4Z8K8_PRUDU|nr:hypothetical protein L3X38_026052 [Prunus dulcis]
MLDCKPVDTPIVQNHHLGEYPDQVPTNKERCQRLVGRLIYLSHTRLDIAYAVSVVSQRRSKGYKDWFDSHEMLDLSFASSKFTRSNKCVLERLDRAICTVKWGRLFSDANKTARLLARIHGIQQALCKGPNEFLSNLEGCLIAEFNNIVDKESLFWKQKSRVQWLQDGDRNTKFFHLTTIIWRRRNKIERLKDRNGGWVEDAEGIKGLAVEYFQGLFNQDAVAPSAMPNKKGFIASKIDLSKAYDRLNWNFIEHVLVELRLPNDLVSLIKSCVTTVRYQLCVNGLRSCSSTWRSILYGTALLSQGLAWMIGKGNSTHLWTDKWVTDAPLAPQEGVSQLTDLNCVVSNFSKNGWWDVNKLRSALHDDLIQKILNVSVGFMGSLPDSHIWRPSPKGVFSVKALEDEVPVNPRHDILVAAHEWFMTSQILHKTSAKIHVSLAWVPRNSGQYKLNVDGTKKSASGCIGLAEDRGIRNLLVEMDFAMAVKLVKNSTTLGLHPVASLASNCWELMGKFDTCALQHIYRERNVVADCIAQWSYNLDLGVCFLDMALSWIGTSLVDHLLGVTRTRHLVCINPVSAPHILNLRSLLSTPSNLEAAWGARCYLSLR